MRCVSSAWMGRFSVLLFHILLGATFAEKAARPLWPQVF